MTTADTFQDFCQAWTSRFPNSELPEAWEEDVRNNLAKHRSRVSQLREELEKEEMYVQYLDKLLNDIEIHRAKSKETESSKAEADNEEKKDKSKDEGGLEEEVAKEFLEDQLEQHTKASLRSSLHLDLESVVEDKARRAPNHPFVTVISVKSPGQKKSGSSENDNTSSKFTFSGRSRTDGGGVSSLKRADGGGVSSLKRGARTTTKPDFRRGSSQESLNSVSSPLSPTSPSSPTSPLQNILLENLLSPREAPASPRDSGPFGQSDLSGFPFGQSDSSADPSPTNTKVKPAPPQRTVSVRDDTVECVSSSCEEEPTSFQSRGRPDGGEGDEVGSSPPPAPAPTFSTFTGHMSTTAAAASNGPSRPAKVNKPPIAVKPEAKRNNSVGEAARSNERRDSARPNERRDSSSTQSDRLVSPTDRRESGGLLRRESIKSENGLLDRKNSRSQDDILTPPLGRRTSNKSRKDSDSSRGRMGSPSGKSHDSSDSDSWGRRNNLTSPSASLPRDILAKYPDDSTSEKGRTAEPKKGGGGGDASPSNKRRISGETRLDRLVRKPSGERVMKTTRNPSTDRLPTPEVRSSTLDRHATSSLHEARLGHPDDRIKMAGPPLPKPRKITRKPDAPEESPAEPLYDLVCNEEAEDEYDNHLLYGTKGANSDLASKDDSLPVSTSADNSGFSGSPSLVKKVVEMEDEETNYVNIQYFLHQTRTSKFDRQDSRDLDLSEDELNSLKSSKSDSKSSLDSKTGLDTSKTSLDSSKTSLEKTSFSSEPESERLKMQTHILTSILDSEAVYLECLSVCLQYMKAMKVTLTTQSPLIPKDDFDVIFYKVPELYEFHHHFHENLKKQLDRWTGEEKIGHHFKMLAQQTKVYAQFISNYPKALDTLHRCSQTYQQFADLTGSIKLRTLKGQQQGQSVSLEDLLHKPVARVQKNCMSLQDLLKHTPESSADFATLTESLRLIQTFLNEYNIQHRGEVYPHQPAAERNSRHLVKNSFIVELAEGARKLRHLFLFNDVLVCAKYKAATRGEKFTFQLKWYIPLSEALMVADPSSEPKETKPANLVGLRTAASALRDQISQVQREEEWRGKGRGGKANLEKPRKQLSEIEAQLVLASPHLLFQVASKSGRTFSFYLSSEYERAQWIETLKTLQSNLPPNTSQAHTLSMVELQSWISSCRKFLKTNMGSFLMRSARDEPLLIGDLHLVIRGLSGLTRHSDLFIVAEIDSYGHYFRKVKTRTIGGTLEPSWNEEFSLELEGSENLRLLVYQEGGPEGVVLRGRACLELSSSWITSEFKQQRISIGDVILTCEMKFVGFEETNRRVPQSKSAGLFKTPIKETTRKEKRAVPFIITSCVREVERRGISEVGIYRVSGSSADMARLRKAYETNPYEAEQLLKECDIHAVAGILKQFLRDIPESIFTTLVYSKLFEAYSIADQDVRTATYLQLFSQLPQNPNQACIVFLIEHLVRVSQMEYVNKMSLHNMATVFGPTMLHAGQDRDKKSGDLLATSTVDVMAQSGILHFFLARRSRGEPIQINV